MSVSTHETHRRSPEKRPKPRIPNREEINTLVREISALQNAGEQVSDEMQREALKKLPEAYNYFAELKSPDMGPKELKAMREVIDTLQSEQKSRESARSKKIKSADVRMRHSDMEKAAGIHRNIAAMADSIDKKGAGIHNFGDLVEEIDAADEDEMKATSSDDWIHDQVKNKKAEENVRAKNPQLNQPKSQGFWGKVKGMFS